jgi:hypothetical protein
MPSTEHEHEVQQLGAHDRSMVSDPFTLEKATTRGIGSSVAVP